MKNKPPLLNQMGAKDSASLHINCGMYSLYNQPNISFSRYEIPTTPYLFAMDPIYSPYNYHNFVTTVIPPSNFWAGLKPLENYTLAELRSQAYRTFSSGAH